MLKTSHSDMSEGIAATDRLINRVNDIDEKTADGMIAPGSQFSMNLNEDQKRALILRREKRQKQIDKTARHNSRSRSTISREGKNGSFKKEIAFNRTKFVPEGGSNNNSKEDNSQSFKGSFTNSK